MSDDRLDRIKMTSGYCASKFCSSNDTHWPISKVERLRRELKIEKLKADGADRWVPCPDHRDKINKGYEEKLCYVCLNERLTRERDNLESKVSELRNTILVDRQVPASMKATIKKLEAENASLKAKLAKAKKSIRSLKEQINLKY